MTVLTLGEALGVLRTSESLAHAASARVGTGGSEANVAIGLTRLGADVAWLGRIGDDGLGRRILRELRGEGVRATAIVDPSAPTGLLLKETDSAGRTEVTYHRRGSAGSRLRPADLELVDLPSISHLHITGITPALSASAAATVQEAITHASRASISFDVNHRERLWSAAEATPTYRALAAQADVLFAGLEEARLLVPDAQDPEEAARMITALGPREVVLKLGAAGALALIDGVLTSVDAVPTSIVDTVGAGDAFVAGWLAERLLGESAAVALRTASQAGARACTHPGDWEGQPTRADLARLTREEPVRR